MMKLKQPLFLCLAAALVFTATGCNMLKGRKAPKEAPIASSVETEFRQRWVTHRTAELTATGVAPAAAQQQAENEFSEKYIYLKEGKK